MQNPIIIAGFGRSGTTWVSDIISKSLGGLLLFEPDHPAILPESKYLIYKDLCEKDDIDLVAMHLKKILGKEIRHPWLLRSHFPSSHLVDIDFINQVWQSSKVIGCKTIRWNHALPSLVSKCNAKLVFIIRNPLAVVASLATRPNFFKEFNWEFHWNAFKDRNPLPIIKLDKYDSMPETFKYAAMWTVTNIKAISDLKKMGLPIYSYEILYTEPYSESTEILLQLGYADVHIPPSCLFNPSMSTQKTFQNSNVEKKILEREISKSFWQNIIPCQQAKQILNLVNTISSEFPTIHQTFHKLNYLEID